MAADGLTAKVWPALLRLIYRCYLLQGFGYVEFGSRKSLDEAVAMSGTKYKDKELFIAVSNPTGRGRGGMQGRGRGDLRGQILMAALCTQGPFQCLTMRRCNYEAASQLSKDDMGVYCTLYKQHARPA